MFTVPAGGGTVNHELAPELNEAMKGRWEPIYRSQLHYLVTWSTRGRKSVLRDRHVHEVQELIRQACDERGYSLLDVAAGADHVHVLVALRPSQSVASVVRELKGRSGLALLTRCPELRVWLGGNLAWDERYAVETVSAARIERVRERLRALHGASDSHEDLAAAS
jgi:REP element-mobilizing transposase RayT